MPIVTAITGKMPNFGDVMFWVSFGDSQQAGAKVQANTIRDICEDSLFCKDYFEKMRFTDEECEFIRKDDPKNPLPIKKRCFMFKVKGAAGGSVRGIRYKTERPQCHEIGTIVETDLGIMRVEEYPFNHGVHIEDGLEIKLFGLTKSERVTEDHKYWTKKCTNDQIYSKSEKRLVKNYIEEAPDWCEAKDLTRRHWIGSPIDYRVEDVQAIEHLVSNITERRENGSIVNTEYAPEYKVPEYFNDNEWWWLYGLWLGDGQIHGKNKHKEGIYRYSSFGWSVAHTQPKIAEKIKEFFSRYDRPVSVTIKSGCDLYTANHSAIARWLASHKNGNSIKNMPDWILKLDFKKQKQILLGYIAADGYIDNKKVSQQVRINSVNLNVLKQLQVICSRLGLPTYIRNTKKAGKQVFTSTGREHDINHQWELRLVENVKEVLGIDVSASTKVRFKQVHIKDGMLWRQFKESNEVKDLKVIPITIKDRTRGSEPKSTYITAFGRSKNCFTFDDIIKNEADAGSAIIMAKLKSMIYSDAENALGKKGKIIIVNTPFNKKDPVYQALEGGVWTPVCLPVCEKIYLDMPKSEYRGSWEAMKPYEEIMEKYEDAYYGDTLREFNQELMLRISSEEDKLIPDKLLEGQWYKRTDILKNLYAYNLYMTTDFTTTGNKGSDLSGIAVWAVNHNQDWFMLDLCLRKQEVEQQYNEVFRFIDTYTPENKTFEVGVEVDGNQRSHIHALKDRMRQRLNYFTIARQRGSQPGAEGILSRLEGGNKHWRMRMMLPMFQNRKIFFPEELRHSPDMVELMDEIRYTSYTRFNCVSGDTLVDTPNGKIMMSDIRHNDSVLTQNGYTSVNSKASNPIITGVEQTYTITTIDGEMHLTAEHKVLTMRGYVMVKDLTSTDLIIRNTECKSSNMDTNGQDKKVDTTNQQHQLMEKENGFIVKYMKEKMEKLKKDMKFIIKMKTKTIMNHLILKYYHLKIINLCMLEEKNTGTIENKEENTKDEREQTIENKEIKIGFVRTVIVSLKSMIKLKMKQNSVANHAEENTVNFKKMRTILNLLQSNVLYAILNLNKNQQIKYAVQKSAEKYILKKTEEVKLSFDCACRATMNSKQLEALHESFAQKNVEILIETSSLQDAHAENVEKNLWKRLQNSSIAQIVASTSLIIKIEKRKIEPVYDFEVKGTNNFSSNNMVIHNCKHDDGMDLLSMINALEVIYPAKNMSYIPTKIKDGRVAADDIYGMINRHSDEEYSAYDSY